MPLLRKEQILAFKSNALDSFITDMVLHLQHTFPTDLATLGITRLDLEPLVRDSISRARGHGLELRNDLRRYLELVPRFGPRFDTGETTAWIAEILHDPLLDGHEKMDAILCHWSP